MPHIQVIKLRSRGWEDDPEDEYLKLGLLDYIVGHVYTNWVLFFKLSDSSASNREAITGTIQRGLEVTLSQCRQLCGYIEPHPNGSGLCFHRNRESTVDFHVQWLDEAEDDGRHPSFEDFERQNFTSQSLGNLDTWSVAPFTGEGPEALPTNNPKVSAFKVSFVKGGMVFVMQNHHYGNDVNGWASALHQLAENCAAVWNSPEDPPWDPACLDLSRMRKPVPERLVEGPKPPPRHPDHVAGQWLLFHLPKSKAAKLKRLATPGQDDGDYWISSYDAYTTYIWRMLTKHRATIFKPDPTKTVIWGVAVNMRKRIRDPPLPERIQGNIVYLSSSMASPVPPPTVAEVISEAPLSKLAW